MKDEVGDIEAAVTYKVPGNTKPAGKLWQAGVMKRHRKLNLRQPDLTSLAGDSGFNEVVVNTILDVWENTVDEDKITHSSIFNMNRKSHAVVQRENHSTTMQTSGWSYLILREQAECKWCVCTTFEWFLYQQPYNSRP